MQRYRQGTSIIQFTGTAEGVSNSDYESDNQPEQRLTTTTNTEVVRVGNLLDQVTENNR